MHSRSHSPAGCIGLTLLLAASSLVLAQPAAPPTSQPAIYSVAANRPYREAIKVGDTLIHDPALKPKGIAGVGLTGDEVTRAINRGRDYLWPILKKRSSPPKWVASRDDLLLCLALMHADAQKTYPEFDALLTRVLDNINPDCLGMYEAPLVIMAAESYGEKYAGLTAQTAQRVINMQGPRGTFSYNWGDAKTPRFVANRPAGGSIGMLKRTTAARTADGDNSVTQYAILALWRASSSGLGIDPHVWELCRQETAKRQCADGGWAYNGPAKSYGSMDCAGVSTTAICLIHQNKEPLDDPLVRRGLAWLVKNWAISQNPGTKDYHIHYYIYGLERLGSILGTEFIGPHEWYPLGARFLVDSQAQNGSWGKRDIEHETCFSLLFLTRATGSMVKQQPPGTLQTVAPEFAVFDKSGREVTRGKLGDSRTLPGGDYILRVSIGGVQFEKAFSVPEGGTTTVTPAELLRTGQ